MSQALAGEPPSVYGDGNQTRCFLHVADAVEAITALAGSPQAVGEVFNVGSGEEVSILGLARRVLAQADAFRGIQDRVIEASERIVLVPNEFSFEDTHRRVPDTSKIPRAIG